MTTPQFDRRFHLTRQDSDRLKIREYDTRRSPQPIPQAEVCAPPLVCLSLNEQWAAHISGSIERLLFPDAWAGPDDQVQYAIDQVQRIIEMLTIGCDDGRFTITFNQNVIIYQNNLENIYEGDIHNVDPDAPDTDFNADSGDGGGDEARRNLALCHACRALVDIYCAQVLMAYGDEAAAAAIITGVLGFLGPAGVAVGLIISGLIFAISGLEKRAFQDEAARQNVACCIYEALKDQPNTLENFTHAPDDCYTAESSFENDITTAMRTAGFGTQGNWLAFNKTLAELMRFARLDLLEPCTCECSRFDWNWAGDHDLTAADWTALTLAEFPAGTVNITGNPHTIGYQFTLLDQSGVNYIVGDGYDGTADTTPTGGEVSVDNGGCFLTEVAITVNGALSTHSSGCNVWVYRLGAWEFAGATSTFPTSPGRRNVVMAIADVEKVAIILNHEFTTYLARVEITFGA